MAGKKKASQSELVRSIDKLSRKYQPSGILKELSIVYEKYSAASTTEAEVDFWLKCSRACGNLSSGTDKWIYEMLEEMEDEDE